MLTLPNQKTEIKLHLIHLICVIECVANHHMDISVGATYSGREGVASSLWPKVDLGYRYQKPDGGFLFKVFATTIGVGAGIGSTF